MKKYFFFLALTVAFFAFVSKTVLASTTDGTIGDKHVSTLLDNNTGLWSSGTVDTEKIFWNTPVPYDVHITDGELTGYLWGPGVGWISLNCSNTNSCGSSDFKVENTDAGVLSGYAWGENAGWVSFSCMNAETNNCSSNNNAKVTIDSDGNFTGYAWSQSFGWIRFDCSSDSACVQTDWRPVSVRSQSSGGENGSNNNDDDNNEDSDSNSRNGGGTSNTSSSPSANIPLISENIQFSGCSGSVCQVTPPEATYPETEPKPEDENQIATDIVHSSVSLYWYWLMILIVAVILTILIVSLRKKYSS